MMISLIYVSTASHLLTTDELLEILHISQKKNKERQVTGMLLYKGGNFMQVLEGPEESVKSIFESIQRDLRHHDVSVLMLEPIEERQFTQWTMAFHNLDEEIASKENAYSGFFDDELIAEKFREKPQLAYNMLLSFRENMR
jgi:uncharacterized Fe-S cluster-containing MiaB family protein